MTTPTLNLPVRVPDRRSTGNRLRGQVGRIVRLSIHQPEGRHGRPAPPVDWLCEVELPRDGDAWDGLTAFVMFSELGVVDATDGQKQGHDH